MRKSKFSESQIVGILKGADAGVPMRTAPEAVKGHTAERRSPATRTNEQERR